MAKLYINEGGKEAVYELFDDSPEVTVGRGASNAVQIADGHASKLHFVLRRVRGRWKLVDLESKNGTRVNGAYKNAHWLVDSDSLTVGNVVLRFDAEGEVAGAPPRAAVPATPARVVAQAAPAQARPAAAAPARPAAAPQRPAAPARAAPAAAVGQETVALPQRASPRRRRDEDDDEDGEERPRFQRKKSGLSGGVIVVIALAAAAVLVLLLSSLLSGDNQNTVTREKARKLRDAKQIPEALRVLETESVPGESGWEPIEKEIEELRGIMENEKGRARYAEARAWHKANIERWIATGPSWRPADAIPEKEAAQRLREFIRTYGDTSLAKEVVNGKDGTNQAYQTILRENQDPDRNATKAFSETEQMIAPAVGAGRLGVAHQQLSFALQVERLSLPPAEYTSFESRVQTRQSQLLTEALTVLQRAVTEGQAMVTRGENSGGKARVRATLRILQWPDGELKRRADEAMRSW